MEGSHGHGRETFEPFPVLLCASGQEMLGQQGNVIRPLL
jgi:hypothetical protein